jgi:hypothetical protein
MKTKIFFIAIVIVTLICCKDKTPITEKFETMTLKEVTLEEFVVLATNSVDKKGLPEGKSIFILKKGYSIIEESYSNIEGVHVKKFPTVWEYDRLKPVLIKFPLSVQLICKEGSLLQIENLEEYLTLYGPEDGFYRVNPKPKYLVSAQDKLFLVRQEGGFWHSREE